MKIFAVVAGQWMGPGNQIEFKKNFLFLSLNFSWRIRRRQIVVVLVVLYITIQDLGT